MGIQTGTEFNNYYTTLECSIDSTLEEIKRSYHKLALKYHPDKSDVNQSSEMFQQIEEAWRTLGNIDSKKEYDAFLRQSSLENTSVLLYSRIKPNELESYDDDEDTLKYTCRCGGDYIIYKSDLKENNLTLHVPCNECTLMIEINT